MRPTPRLLSILALVTSCAAPAGDVPDYEPWLDFIPGRYAIVGQSPDNGPPYAGSAVISVANGAFSLTRTIGSTTVIAKGTIEVPSPPGEGKVLRFRWVDGTPHLMTCLVHGDLDNHARLTCAWIIEGVSRQMPGLEAYFSSEPWSPSRP